MKFPVAPLFCFSILALSTLSVSAQSYYIDPSIQGSELATITSVMNVLEPAYQNNVIFIDSDETIYANREALKSEVEFATHVSSYLYQWSDGKQFVVPQVYSRPLTDEPSGTNPDVISPTCTGNTGPYRRAYSTVPASSSVPGYSYDGGNVHLGDITNISLSSSDTGYVYLGGWGGTSDGGAVDAGFQYSSANNNWAPIIFYETPTGRKVAHSSTHRFLAAQDEIYAFSVPSNNMVMFYSRGEDYPSGLIVDRTIVVKMDASYGWKANGDGNVLKRMTSIAQNGNAFKRTEHITGVHWFGATIGTSSSNSHPWSPVDTGGADPPGGDYQSFPDCSKGTSYISVNWLSPAEETDAINLGG